MLENFVFVSTVDTNTKLTKVVLLISSGYISEGSFQCARQENCSLKSSRFLVGGRASRWASYLSRKGSTWSSGPAWQGLAWPSATSHYTIRARLAFKTTIPQHHHHRAARVRTASPSGRKSHQAWGREKKSAYTTSTVYYRPKLGAY